MADKEYRKIKNRAKMSLTLLILAVITITTATYAWFTIVNNSTVNQISLDVTAGVKLRVSTDFSTDITDYTDKITNEMINKQIAETIGTSGFDNMTKLRLTPLTSGNGVDLYTQNANTLPTRNPAGFTSGGFMEMTLWFMSSTNMDVYLNRDSTDGVADDGTYFRNADTNTAYQNYVTQCTRMSVTPYYSGTDADNQVINASPGGYINKGVSNMYEPNKTVATTIKGHALTDAAGVATQNTFDVLGTNAGLANGADTTKVLFKLKENIPVRVVFKIWIEGEDPQCLNNVGTGAGVVNIEKAKFLAMLRFCGASADGAYME